jgi:hypothetical protein
MVNNDFKQMADHIGQNYSWCQILPVFWHIKSKLKITVRIYFNDLVGHRRALIVFQDKLKNAETGEQVVDIVMNRLDFRNFDLSRLLIGHEIGHLIARHNEGLCEVWDFGIGDINDPEYNLWRNEQEDEADAFGLNLLYAFGRPVEREILAESDYGTRIGDLPNDDDRVPRTNDRSFRGEVFDALHDEFYVRQPVNLICHVLAHYAKAGKIKLNADVRELAKSFHLVYRTYLKGQPASSEKMHEPCLSCSLSHKQVLKCPVTTSD